MFSAGKKVTEDEVEEMLETDNLQIFTQDVSYNGRGGGHYMESFTCLFSSDSCRHCSKEASIK